MIILAMMMLMMGLLLVLFVAYMAGKDTEEPFLFFIMLGGLAFLVMGSTLMYYSGTGELSMERLKTNSVYEVLSSAQDKGKYAVILREQDGHLAAYLLDKNPPNVFKAVDNENDPYQLFPPQK